MVGGLGAQGHSGNRTASTSHIIVHSIHRCGCGHDSSSQPYKFLHYSTSIDLDIDCSPSMTLVIIFLMSHCWTEVCCRILDYVLHNFGTYL
jgi:hypothetical protein